jgi:Helix-turn-helix domain
MAKVNISQAAQMAGVSRPTIHKKINAGKLSVEKVDGKTLIDVSELERVFGSLLPPGSRKDLHSDTSDVTAVLRLQIEHLQRELDVTRQERDRDRDEYRQERDRLLTIIERQALPAGRGWWRRWFT